MAGYEDTRQKIISTLMGRPNGTEIQPENHQDYALNMLDYIRSLELIATSTLIGVAESNSTPVQPNASRVCYIAGVAQNQTVTFENFIGENGNPISVTTGDMEGVFVILMWNTQYWSAQTFSTNIISQSESATFYYRYNIRKTYESIALMNADVASPIGTDGKYIKVGDIVTVVNSTTPSENGIYSYEGTTDGWKYQSSFNFQLEQIRSQNTNTAPSSKLFDDKINELASDIVQVETDLNALEQEQIQGGVYDVSSHNDGAVFESLSTLLGSANLSTLIPTSVRRGGMSIRFVQSSDNKYVQYRYMGTVTTAATFTNVANWQGVDDEPTAESNNLVKSGGVKEYLDLLDIKHTNDQEFVRVSDKIAIQGYYNTNSGWNIGNIVSPTVISNRNSAIYNIPVYAGDVYLIKLRNNYPSFSWYALLDSNNRLLEKSTDNTVGLKEKTICIEKNGTLVINLYEGFNYFNELYIAKQSIVQKERLYDISVNGDTVIKYNGTVDIPVTDIIREVEQKGASAVVSKTITSEDLLDKGFYGAFYLASNKIVYNVIPDNETVETNRCIKEYCKGFRYIYLQPNNYTDQFIAGTFVDKEGNFVKILSWNFDAVPQVDGTYQVEVPESAEYAYIWTYGNKETFDAFEAKMEMIMDAPNAEEAPKYKMYKKNVSNGLLSLFNQFESELIPVEYLDTIEVKTIHNFYYIRAYDENRTQINYVDIVDGSNYSEEDGVKKYVFGIYSQQIKYFKVGLKRKAYGFLTKQLTNTEISIYKGGVSTNSIFSQKDMYYLGKQFNTYSSPASDHFGTPIFKVEPFDTIKHLAFPYKTIGVDLGRLGLYFYDDAFNIIGYGEKTGENGTYVTDTVPDGAVYGQFISYNKTVTDDVVCTINRTSKTKEFVNTRNDVRYAVPFSRVIQEKKGAELIDVGNEKNLYVGYTSNCSSLITSNGSYLIFGGWAEVYRYNTPMGSVLWMKKSTDKGRTWSKMKVLFDTISFTPDSQHIVYMHSPSAVVNKNGRILLQFTLDNTDAVNTTMGDVDGANVKPEKRVCLIYSDDDGESWSEITDLTKYIIAKYSSIYSLYGSYGRCCCANGILAYSFYKFKAESSETAKGFLMYSSDDGETWSCTDAVTGLNNEISLCEGGDNNILVLVRGSQVTYNKKEVYWINAANGLGELIHDENLSNSRIFDEAAGMGEEGEFGEVKRIRLNDHYAYLFAMQADDTRNVTLFVSHDLKKFIPVCNLMTIVPAIRAYSFMDVKEHEILCCNRTSDKVIVHICGGVYSQIESVGISEDVKKAIAPITFSAEDDAATLATKMNSLVALMQSNGYMKDWRDYINKMSYACEAQPNKPYDSFTKAATNQGVMYAFKKVEGYFRIRITLPAQNVTSNATTVKFATTWNSGASLHSYNAPIVSRDEEFVVAEYEGNGLVYGEALFVWFYDGVAQSAITTDGIKVEIFE